MSTLEDIVKEIRSDFAKAKSDGVLDAGEVVQIAVKMAQKMASLASLSGSEKKAILIHTLKKGLDDDGGIDMLQIVKDMNSEAKEAFKAQLITAASVSIDMIFNSISGKIDLRKPSSWIAYIPACISLAQTVVPEKDKALVSEALSFSKGFLAKTNDVTVPSLEVRTAEPSQ